MAKTITAMLVGIAIAENKIRSIGRSVSAYVPGLANTEYAARRCGRCCICRRRLVFGKLRWRRRCRSPRARSVSCAGQGPRRQRRPVQTPAVAPPETKWHYASSETEILGLVLRAAVGQPVADYLGERIWQPIGTRPTHHGSPTAPDRK